MRLNNLSVADFPSGEGIKHLRIVLSLRGHSSQRLAGPKSLKEKGYECAADWLGLYGSDEVSARGSLARVAGGKLGFAIGSIFGLCE